MDNEINVARSSDVDINFFKNPLFCSKLQSYLFDNYAVTAQISSQGDIDNDMEFPVEFVGDTIDIEHARDFIKELFRTVKTKVYNDETNDDKIISWSKNIHSDAAIIAIQKIFDNRNLFTVWEKTHIISGYYTVHYFSSNPIFEIQESSIDFVLNNTISYCEYLLADCVDEIKKIEFEHRDDNVKIQIRENVIYAPKYLTQKIQQLIKSLIVATTSITFRCIGNSCLFNTKKQLELEHVARKTNCQIDRIGIQTENELLKLPKARTTLTIQSTSKYIIEESNRFLSTLTMVKKLPISNGAIEICQGQISLVPAADVTIIAVSAMNNENFYLDIDLDKNILFIPWIEPSTTIESDLMNVHLEQSIKTFVSLSLAKILTVYSNDARRITISTSKWENYSNKKQLAEVFIHELKQQMELEHYCHCQWTILFVFNDQQFDLYDLFSQVILSMQNESPQYDQFYYPISTITIHLETSRKENVIKYRNIIDDYFRKHIISTIEINNVFDPQIWNQHMINVYYKYSLDQCVIPIISSDSERQKLELTGSIVNINKLEEKYALMSKIMKEKTSTNQQSIITKQFSWDISFDRYDILIMCCFEDESFSNCLATHLIDDGYLVCVNLISQQSPTDISQFDKTDLILIYFSQHSSKNEDFIAQIKLAKISEKIIISIVPQKIRLDQEKNWLEYMTIIDLYYELFQHEVQFELDEKFDLEYDKLLVQLLQYTKSDQINQTNSIANNDSIEEQQTFNEQNLQSSIIDEQRDKTNEIYEKRIETIRNREKIPIDELTHLIESLTLVIDYCTNYNSQLVETIDRGKEEEEQYYYQTKVHQHNESANLLVDEVETQHNLNDFALCARRWIDKASEGIATKGSIPPFSITGDINDALYSIFVADKIPWWTLGPNYPDFDHSPPNIYFHNLPVISDSWFTYQEVDDFFHTLINRDIQFHIETRKQRRIFEKFGRKTKLLHDSTFTTELKEGESAWNFTQDKLVLNEYKRMQTRNKTTKLSKNLTAWQRLVLKTVELSSDIDKGRIDLNSDLIQGRIGDELKTQEELQKLNELDDPKYSRWTIKKPRRCTHEFLQTKIQNTIEVRKLCNMSVNIFRSKII
ncbi:unnamed protein product [Adineta steineri]|uniref:Uncharacterized protein n=1 Tax=Adineta steineri TaxID=433720 RepID=A0A815PGS1_9BILA|nr:unnamed protein product [Adineta steineri]CAF1448678.1 unnamed protein product [Adineta steineri]